MKSARARRAYLPLAYKATGCMDNNYSACQFLVNWLVRLHAVSLPLSLFKLERKKASCYRDLSETYLGTGHDFGE